MSPLLSADLLFVVYFENVTPANNKVNLYLQEKLFVHDGILGDISLKSKNQFFVLLNVLFNKFFVKQKNKNKTFLT